VLLVIVWRQLQEYIVNHAEMKVVFVSKDNIGTFMKTLDKTRSVTHIIQYDYNRKYANIKDAISDEHRRLAEKHNVALVGYSELRAAGAKGGHFPDPPKPDELAVSSYIVSVT
jgi:long-subunit acyl-CoA synthetase (AMP-forming)